MNTFENFNIHVDAEQQNRVISALNTINAADRLPIIDPTDPADSPGILQFFAYHHLSGDLREASKPFSDLAHQLVATLPSCAERSTALRKLLEAKDCAVRSVLSGRNKPVNE